MKFSIRRIHTHPTRRLQVAGLFTNNARTHPHFEGPDLEFRPGCRILHWVNNALFPSFYKKIPGRVPKYFTTNLPHRVKTHYVTISLIFTLYILCSWGELLYNLEITVYKHKYLYLFTYICTAYALYIFTKHMDLIQTEYCPYQYSN